MAIRARIETVWRSRDLRSVNNAIPIWSSAGSTATELRLALSLFYHGSWVLEHSWVTAKDSW
jgi:hypothetical protein